MPSPFSGIYVSSNALQAFQRAMQVTGHNMANVNTRGYSRQTVDYQTNVPGQFYSNGVQSLGTGVSIASVSRARDLFLNFRMQSAMSDSGRSTVLAGALKSVESVYNEPGPNGISDALDGLFNSWSALASNPNDSTARWQVQNAGQTLTTRVRETYGALQNLEDNAKTQIKGNIETINNYAERINDLNRQIRASVSAGAEPGDLADQRDLLIEDLSKTVKLTTNLNQDGSMSVYVSNFPLVQESNYQKLPTTYDVNTQSLTDGTHTYPIRGGELLGNIQTLQKISAAKSDLDQFSNNLRTEFNQLHSTGINALGNTGVNFFADVAPGDPQTGAIDFKLDAAILADPKAIAAGTTGNAGDSSLAQQISALKSKDITGLGSSTFSSFYQDSLTGISTEVNYYASASQTHDAIVEQIQNQVASISGVNLDDEMADMVRLQRSYQAAAKVLSIMDQTTDDLINLIR